ncbi:MAG TPA: ABC transporter permease subunit, partial [Clostridia bacterium]|nr:ABC transporter permease subunit [Clostridia bacterium]
MLFLRQVRFEIKNILRSKFILIIGILILAICIATPIISLIGLRSSKNEGMYYGYSTGMGGMGMIRSVAYDMPWYPGPGGYEEDPIIVDGVTIKYDNPFFWNVKSLIDERGYMENDKGNFSDPKVLDIILSTMDAEQEYFVYMAEHITDHRDYRVELSWAGRESIYDKFAYEHTNLPKEQLYEAMSYRMGYDPEVFDEKFINITPEQRLAAIDEIDEQLNLLYKVVETGDFPLFIDLRIKQETKNIEDIKERITVQEKIIIDDPSQEEWVSQYIMDMNNEIDLIETNNIPTLEYRLENNIIPGDDIWQNTALSNIEMNKRNLMYNKILTEEEFNKDRYMVEEYKTYRRYESIMQEERDGYNNQIIIAERSLDAGKPDMNFEPWGARSRTFNFLSYSSFVAMFAILIGGWLMASEFQQGTIRLLMIRPKTRTKILMAKFLSSFIIFLGLYALGSLLNMVTNGACFGFKDFLYPNFTISGETNFFAYYLPKFAVCIMPAIFTFSLSFLLSVLIRNIAVAIIIPIALFIGSTILMQLLVYGNSVAKWLAFTPIPYMDFTNFFSQYSIVKNAIQKGIPLGIGYGILMLLGLSVVFVIFSIFTFK